MLRDGGNELLGCEDLKVFLVAPMGHGRPVKDLAGILDRGDPSASLRTSLLLREGVSQDIFRQGLLTVPVVSGYLISGMHAESAVMPGHEFFNKPVRRLFCLQP